MHKEGDKNNRYMTGTVHRVTAKYLSFLTSSPMEHTTGLEGDSGFRRPGAAAVPLKSTQERGNHPLPAQFVPSTHRGRAEEEEEGACETLGGKTMAHSNFRAAGCKCWTSLLLPPPAGAEGKETRRCFAAFF
ncbi:hypothetical protein CKAH01_12503 [Colletotrichum kahawae]|uniref:Uncharacterized protein n=1 Tax=Colletotrichum kahawae TaxID=34407 RepID=A0AAD9YTE4_COLKA|nr:hypothetical protein CKAH01_12503 [Colletotrichum kahawae]